MADDFQQKIDSLLAVQAQHDEQIQALIRVAELQQDNLERLDDSISEVTRALAQERSERIERQNEMAQRQKYFDERVDRLVSAIGEYIRGRDEPRPSN
jgi:ribosomal protein S13